MDFKIDTRDTFAVITPESETITANLTDELQLTFNKMRQSGSQNFIVDFQNCNNIDEEAIENLVAMHEQIYAMGKSLVFTGIKGKVLVSLKENETDQLINLAPKMIEAIDIISMEMLERDLYSEES